MRLSRYLNRASPSMDFRRLKLRSKWNIRRPLYRLRTASGRCVNWSPDKCSCNQRAMSVRRVYYVVSYRWTFVVDSVIITYFTHMTLVLIIFDHFPIYFCCHFAPKTIQIELGRKVWGRNKCHQSVFMVASLMDVHYQRIISTEISVHWPLFWFMDDLLSDEVPIISIRCLFPNKMHCRNLYGRGALIKAKCLLFAIHSSSRSRLSVSFRD